MKKLNFCQFLNQLYINMKIKTFLLGLVITTTFCSDLFCQVEDQESASIFRRSFNKELTEFYSQKYVFSELLDVKHKQTVDISWKAITSAKSGELTTLVYHSDDLDTQGVVFVFWNDYLYEYNIAYNGYSFKSFEMADASELLNLLDKTINEKKSKIKEDDNIVLRYDDVVFSFSGKAGEKGNVMVFWDNCQSLWTIANLKATIKRTNKFLQKKNK